MMHWFEHLFNCHNEWAFLAGFFGAASLWLRVYFSRIKTFFTTKNKKDKYLGDVKNNNHLFSESDRNKLTSKLDKIEIR